MLSAFGQERRPEMQVSEVVSEMARWELAGTRMRPGVSFESSSTSFTGRFARVSRPPASTAGLARLA